MAESPDSQYGTPKGESGKSVADTLVLQCSPLEIGGSPPRTAQAGRNPFVPPKQNATRIQTKTSSSLSPSTISLSAKLSSPIWNNALECCIQITVNKDAHKKNLSLKDKIGGFCDIQKHLLTQNGDLIARNEDLKGVGAGVCSPIYNADSNAAAVLSIVFLGTDCSSPHFVNSVGPSHFDLCRGGTSPVTIMKNSLAVEQIRSSDVWVLCTDGEVPSYEVEDLTQHAEKVEVLPVPIILIIIGHRRSAPNLSNISVGISFFAAARDALILFQDYSSGELFVLNAKGADFEILKPKNLDDSAGWMSLPRFADESEFNKHCEELSISLSPSTGTRTRSVSLGAEWDHTIGNAPVLLSALLEQNQIRTQDLQNLLAEEAISQLALLCKTRGQLPQLRDLVVRHKQQEVILRLEDRHEELRKAHAANRKSYSKLRNEPSDEQRQASELNKLINRGLEIIAGIEKSGHTADILNRKSNRAKRSHLVTAADSEIHLAALDLSDDINALRLACAICCGEQQIMSITLKRLDTVEENTTDFALNFPLAAAQAKQNAI
ncbi:MAG: hypothetical protein L6R40_001522 [Gallowayella cf. fulva]|nr:MAG: hypothetical protein L6R40_001522 [Xanthomendoza cf. fulva]